MKDDGVAGTDAVAAAAVDDEPKRFYANERDDSKTRPETRGNTKFLSNLSH